MNPYTAMEGDKDGTQSPTLRRTPAKVKVRRERHSLGDFLFRSETPVKDTSGLGFSIGNLKPSNQKNENLDAGSTKESVSRRRTKSFAGFPNVHNKPLDHENKSNSANDGARELNTFLFNLWSNQQLCDIVIRVNGKEYLAHKLALAAYSEKFTSRYCERQRLPASLSEINLLNSTAEAVEEVLNYIYTNQLRITDLNVDALIVCAKQLGVSAALSMCKQYLMGFNQRNVISLMQVAEKHGFMEIVERMEASMFDNFTEITKLDSFLNSRYDIVIKLLSKESLKLKVLNELDVFFAIIAWIDFNRQERLQFATQLLECVRFANISPENLVKYVEPQRTIFQNPVCKEMLYTAFKVQALQQSGGDPLTYASPPRPRTPTRGPQTPNNYSFSRDITDLNQSYSCSRAAVNPQIPTKSTFDGLEASQTRDIGDFGALRRAAGTGYQISSMPQASKQTKMTQRLGPMPLPPPPRPATIIMVGGINPFDSGSAYSSKLVEQYNPKTNNWQLFTTLPDSRHHHGAVILDGYLYVVGGSLLVPEEPNNLANPTDTCFRYCPNGNFWTRTASLQTARMYHGLATLEGVMYAVGGHDIHGRSLDTVEYYNPDTDSWGLTERMSEAKIGMAVAGYHGLLYVVGGFYESASEKIVLDTVECYNPRTNSWINRQPLPSPCCHANLVIVDDQLYLIGGSNMEETSSAVTSLSNVYLYNEDRDTWTKISDLPVPRHDAGVGVVGSKMYVIGGVSSQEGCVLADVECLDVNSLTWTGCEPLQYPALGLTCCSFFGENRV